MVLLMILVASSSYCQYPIIKKIGNDSLILMTLKQGDDVNKSFVQNKKKIDSLRDLIKVKDLTTDSLAIELNKTNNKHKLYNTKNFTL